jgi:AsmA-like C-terminal region
VVRQVYDFDRMRVPFSVGYGQFVLEDSYMRGPIVGVSLRGKVDFKAGRMTLGGTYVPLQGLNNALGGIPVLGQILSGPRGEGIFGITFAVQGSMQQPQVIVNPLSLVAPGIFRSMTEMTGTDPRVTPRDDTIPQGRPQVRSVAPQGSEKPIPAPPPGKPRNVQPEVIGGWSSDTSGQPPAPKKK